MPQQTARRPHWRRSAARRRADQLLDLQCQRDELRAGLEQVTFLDPRRRRAVGELLALYRVVAPVERRLQGLLEADVALDEGYQPPTPPSAGSARPAERRRAA